MNNSMLALQLYRDAGTWCFTDESRNLTNEPFVLGIPAIIDKVIQDNEIDPHNPTVIFSENEFPQCQGYLAYEIFEQGGVWYSLQELHKPYKHPGGTLRGWLCPATLKFFPCHPKRIYFKLENSVKNADSSGNIKLF
jgi:hypothetical protein